MAIDIKSYIIVEFQAPFLPQVGVSQVWRKRPHVHAEIGKIPYAERARGSPKLGVDRQIMVFAEMNSFYPAYLRAHSSTGNQVLHFIGSVQFYTLIALAFVLKQYWLIAAAIIIAYILPGIGHRFFQHNESFRTSKPVICVLCAFRLFIDTLSFRIHKKMRSAFSEQR